VKKCACVGDYCEHSYIELRCSYLLHRSANINLLKLGLILHKPAYIQSSDKSIAIITITLVRLGLMKNVLLMSLLEALLNINISNPTGYVTQQQI